jgi:hypothetical protein
VRRFLILAATLGAALGPSAAQAQGTSNAERDVMAVVDKLFDSMRARDTAALRSVFAPGALLGSIETTNGVSSLKRDAEGVDGFAKALGRPSNVVWDERIAHPVVRVDGDLAMVWVDYTFYAGERKSHCGVDAFQLVKGAQGWKIETLMDTRRREGCPEIAKKG